MTIHLPHKSRIAISRWLVALSLVAGVATRGRDLCAQQTRAVEPAAASDTAESVHRVDLPADFVIGPDDVLSIVFWRDKEMSTQVTVRPDGKISLPLLGEMQAAGLTPAGLSTHLTAESKRFFANPNITVIVNQVNSRKVFITGQIAQPGSYALTGPMTVLQLISMAGGLKDFADGKNITIVRRENGQTSSYAFNFKEIGRNLRQNIDLKPGDTVVVP